MADHIVDKLKQSKIKCTMIAWLYIILPFSFPAAQT